jgi:hypothetical protein
MSDSPNVSVVRRLYQARGNPEVIRQVLASNVRWEVVEGFPYGGVYVALTVCWVIFSVADRHKSTSIFCLLCYTQGRTLHLLIAARGGPGSRGSGPTTPLDRGMRAGANGLDHVCLQPSDRTRRHLRFCPALRRTGPRSC